MKKTGLILLVFAIIVFLGGLTGYLKGGSTGSVIMGTSFGIALLFTSLLAYKRVVWGAYLGLILTLILDAFFTYRFVISMNMMPAGLMTIISTLVLIFSAKSIGRVKHGR